jgi:glutaredoxin
MMSLLSRWAGLRPRESVGSLEVTVYTRAQCCCCHKALDLLKTYQRRHGFAIHTVDIDADPDLRVQYDTLVPVVAVNGTVRFMGVFNPVLFERLLAAEGGGR